MKCTQCGQRGLGIAAFANTAGGKTDYKCDRCMAKNQAQSIKSVREIDELIAQYEKLDKTLEDIIKQLPQPLDIPKGLGGFAMSPMSSYKSVQIFLAELRPRRMELLAEVENESRLQYELEKALKDEDYDKAAEIRAKLQGDDKKT